MSPVFQVAKASLELLTFLPPSLQKAEFERMYHQAWLIFLLILPKPFISRVRIEKKKTNLKDKSGFSGK